MFASFLKELLDGVPLGRALEYFNERYAALAAALTSQLQLVRNRIIPDDAFKGQVTANWLEHNDARNYVIFGDPAVRVRAADGTPPGRKDVADAIHHPTAPTPAGVGPVPFGEALGGPATVPTAASPPAPAVPPPAPFDPDQIAASEQRYDALLGPSAFSFDTVGTRDLLQRNSRDRLVRRFRKLGLSPDRAAAAADRILEGDDGPVDFATDIAVGGKYVGLEQSSGRTNYSKRDTWSWGWRRPGRSRG